MPMPTVPSVQQSAVVRDAVLALLRCALHSLVNAVEGGGTRLAASLQGDDGASIPLSAPLSLSISSPLYCCDCPRHPLPCMSTDPCVSPLLIPISSPLLSSPPPMISSAPGATAAPRESLFEPLLASVLRVSRSEFGVVLAVSEENGQFVVTPLTKTPFAWQMAVEDFVLPSALVGGAPPLQVFCQPVIHSLVDIYSHFPLFFPSFL